MKHAAEGLCPKFQAAIEVLAKPWTGIIVAVLAEQGPLRFRELGARIGAIGDRMLSDRLKELESLGVVERRVLPDRPIGVEYRLSEAGLAFREVGDAMGRWGEKLLAAQASSCSPHANPEPPPTEALPEPR